jgi:UV DNA damage endonuclease
MRLGYCCISMGINEKKKKADHITVNRGMIKRTFESRGLLYVSELVKQNLNDTLKIIDWNVKNKIFVYRLSSDSFPWMTHYKFEDLPDFSTIKALLQRIGNQAKLNEMRLSLHPGPYCVLSSENDEVVTKTIDELDKHAQILDLMGLEQSTLYPVNIHVGSTKPSREEAAARFCLNFDKLQESTKKRLTIENDDMASQYSVKHLYELIHKKIGIPIVIDTLHHACFDDGLPWKESLELAISTWQTKPVCHHSSSKKLHEDVKSKIEAHSDWLYEQFENFGFDVDVELECKQKDLALLKYRKDFQKG